MGTNNIQTGVACGQLLLQLSGVKLTKNVTLLPHHMIDAGLRLLNQTYGVKLKRKKIRFSKLTSKDLPLAFCSTDDNEYKVLVGIHDTNSVVQHPFEAQVKLLTREQLHACWSNKVIVLSSGSLRFNLAWFVSSFWQHRRLLTEILFFSFILQLLALVLPLFFQIIIDKVLVYRVYATLDVLIFGLVLTSIFEVLLRGLRAYQYAHTVNRVDILLGIKLVKHLLGLPLFYFKNRSAGTLVEKIYSLGTIRKFLSEFLFTFLIDFSFISLFLVVMWMLSPLLTCVVLSFVPLYIFISWSVSRPLHDKLETQFRYNAASTALLSESIAGAETVKSLAIEPYFIKRWETQTRDLVDASYRTQIFSSLANHIVHMVDKLSSVLVLWYGVGAVINLEITLGQLIAFDMLARYFYNHLTSLVGLWFSFIQFQVAVDNLSGILNVPIEQTIEGQEHVLQGGIILEQVTFRYKPSAPLVLQGISVHIQAGQQIGIVGESGSGKSTLAYLLLGLYLPEQGKILFDGVSLNVLNMHHLRQQIGLVLQESFLFNRTIRDNIAHCCPWASLEEVMAVAELAVAHEFILRLPMGYDTLLTEGGSSLSGGQRQRIALARALLRNPKVLILDEAISSLDNSTQALIQGNMHKIADGRTVITIAHRLSTVRDCDHIFVFQQGKIIEQGNHERLLKFGGKYASLWYLQQDFKLSNQVK